jgi:micrococcal nuclease
MSIHLRHKPALLACCALIGCGALGSAAPQMLQVGSAQAIDGDSVSVEFRLKGVDAFEHDAVCADAQGRCTACGKDAQNLLKATLQSGRSIDISTSGSQSYDRMVATVAVDGRDAGETMIRSGYAIPIPKYLKDDPERLDRYSRAFETAITQRAGAFAGNWIKPEEWRRGARLKCEMMK